MIVVVDTSALGKLLVEEDESAALRRHLLAAAEAGDTFCISSLAAAELRRLATRLEVPPDRVEPVLAPFSAIRLSEGILQLAGRLPQRRLRTLDAIHVATALAIEAGVLLTYDVRQAEAASDEGLRVDTP